MTELEKCDLEIEAALHALRNSDGDIFGYLRWLSDWEAEKLMILKEKNESHPMPRKE